MKRNHTRFNFQFKIKLNNQISNQDYYEGRAQNPFASGGGYESLPGRGGPMRAAYPQQPPPIRAATRPGRANAAAASLPGGGVRGGEGGVRLAPLPPGAPALPFVTPAKAGVHVVIPAPEPGPSPERRGRPRRSIPFCAGCGASQGWPPAFAGVTAVLRR